MQLLATSQSGPFPRLQGLAPLPAVWSDLGPRFLGWIFGRGALPTVGPAFPPRQRRTAFAPGKSPPAPGAPAADLDRLWQAFAAADNAVARQLARSRLLDACVPLLAAIGRPQPLPAGLSRGDLQQEAFIGLCAAVESFQPGHGVPFLIHARRRMRGAALDALRRWRRQSTGRLRSAYAPHRPVRYAPPADRAAQWQDLMETLQKGLSPRQRAIVHFCLVERHSNRRAARRLGLHPSRVAQLRRALLETWRGDPRLWAWRES